MSGFRNQLLTRLIVANSVITRQGMFFYNSGPAPVAGGLIASIGVTTGGTDGAGNAYLAGDSSYRPVVGGFEALQDFGGALTWYTAPSAAGPYTALGFIQPFGHVPTTTMQLATNPGDTFQFQNSLALIRPSGDATGVTDAAAIVAALGSGFTPCLAQGTWNIKAGQVILGSGQSLLRVGGPWDGIINGVGTGDVIRAFTSSGQYLPGGGKIAPYLVNMTGMGSGSSAFHLGDLSNLEVDCYAENPPSGCIAHWLDNQYLFTEQIHGRLWFHMASGVSGATGVQFDNSTGTSLSANATGSFDRGQLDIMCDGKGAGNLVVFANGAFMTDGRLGIYGNTDYSPAGHGPYYVLTLTGSNAGGFSRISNSRLDIGVECNATVGVQPGTINFNTGGSNTILGCTGIIDFSAANAFASAVNFFESFQFDGPAYGDTKLQSSGPLGLYRNTDSGSLSNGSEIFTRYEMLVKVVTSGNVTGIILQGFASDNWRLVYVWNKGPGTITFDVAATSHVANGTSCVIQPNSGMFFAWDNDDALWYPQST